MKNSFIFFLIFLKLHFLHGSYGLCISPVADLFLNKPLNTTIHEYYASNNPDFIDMRAGQALYNELVSIEFSHPSDSYMFVRKFNCFFSNHEHKQNSFFWVAKKNIYKFEKDDPVIEQAVPTPIDFREPSSVINSQVATLITPWFNPLNKTWYSAGTRFKRSFIDNNNKIGIYYYDPKKNACLQASISEKNIFIQKNISLKDRQKLFVSLLKNWAKKTSNGIIPYVWGGNSYLERVTDDFECLEENNLKVCSHTKQNPAISGFDCSGLILTAAQTVGLPYFYKNTATLADNLRPLSDNEKLENGDFLWFKGHIMIISDIKKNLILEAAGYFSGFGKIQEISLKKRFKGIATYANLITAHRKKLPLILLDKNGKKIRAIKEFKILKLNSIF